MEDEAHVRLVDPHAEGGGGDDRLDLVVHEAVLQLHPSLRAEPRVVGLGGDARLPQLRGQLLARFAGGDVDDAGLLGLGDGLDQRPLFAVLLAEAVHREVEVRAVEAADEHRRVLHPQPLDDLATDRGRGGRGQRQQGRVAELVGEGAEAEVVGAEVVPPLADAVRLVDDQQRGLRLAELLQHLLFGELLGRQQDELALAPAQRLHQLFPLSLRDGRVQFGGLAGAALLHRLDLVPLQRDQG